MLPAGYAAFINAVSSASPSGIAIVETAIQNAIDNIETELKKLKVKEFESGAFIPKRAFGAADRSPEIALHHTRAHAVITDTLVGVKQDLVLFQDACKAATAVFAQTEDGVETEMMVRTAVVQALAQGAGDYGDDAYNQAVYENAHVQPTDERPTA